MTLRARHESPPDRTAASRTTPWWLVRRFRRSRFIAAIAVRQVLTGDQLTTFVFGAAGRARRRRRDRRASGTRSRSRQRRGELLRREARRRRDRAVASSGSPCSSPTRSPGVRRHLRRLAVAVRDSSASPPCLIAVAVFQIDGYVGPEPEDARRRPGRAGLQTLRAVVSQNSLLDPLADNFLDSVDSTRARIAQSGSYPRRARTSTSRASIPGWTGPTSGSPRSWAVSTRLGCNQAYHMYALYGVTDPTAIGEHPSRSCSRRVGRRSGSSVPAAWSAPLTRSRPAVGASGARSSQVDRTAAHEPSRGAVATTATARRRAVAETVDRFAPRRPRAGPRTRRRAPGRW